MNVPKILQHPHGALRTPCSPVTEFGEPIRALARDMFTAMRFSGARGVGLAANQIGDFRRVIVTDASGSGVDMRVMVNPVIVRRADWQTVNDGCLSVGRGKQFGRTRRSKRIWLEFQDEDGNAQKLKASGFFAGILQHELDHLDGVLFIDQLAAVA
jgi:peptide deformylase